MDLQLKTCPKCGGPATLVQMSDGIDEIPDLRRTWENARVPVKVEEFRCQDPSCEYEFERIIREHAE
jgi:hypothetical protein